MALISFSSTSFADIDEARYQLQKAISLLDDGNFDLALRRFKRISTNYDFPKRIKREASYYIGYCYVKQSDPWKASEVLADFIQEYQETGDAFIPDALYVMGRTLEEIGETRRAIRAYKKCINNYGQNEFSRKSRRRLKELNSSNSGSGSDPYNGDHDNYGSDDSISREVREVIRRARREHSYYQKDEFILNNLKHAKTSGDFTALCSEISNEYSKQQYLTKIQRLKAFRRLSARTVINLASHANNSAIADQFIYDSAKVLELDVRGYRLLASKCSNSYYRGMILDIAKENMNNSDNYDDNYNNDHHSSGVSRQIRDILEMAKLENNVYARDQYLLSAVKKAKYGEDFIALLQAMDNPYTKGELLNKTQVHPAFKTFSPRTVVQIAESVGNDYTKHEFLVAAANKIAFTARGYRTLAEACTNTYYRQQILEKAKDSLNNYNDYGYATSGRESLDRASLSKTSSDPFVGFNFQKAQTKRVSKFIEAVKTKKDIKIAVRKLTQQDLKIPTVKIHMKTFRSMEKFNRIHNN